MFWVKVQKVIKSVTLNVIHHGLLITYKIVASRQTIKLSLSEYVDIQKKKRKEKAVNWSFE